jgi:type II secretory pathway component PulF
MRLSLREKATFYQHSAQLLRSGIPLPQAMERLSTTSGGRLRAFLRSISRSLADGQSFSEALTATGTASQLERSSLAALERTGRLEDGLQQLAGYYEALNRSRGEIISRSAYPIFILHLGALLVHLPLIFTAGAGATEYLKKTGFILLVFYGVIALFALLIPLLRDSGATSSSTDWFLRKIPLIGKIRRSFALSRFCAAYDMQLSAGVNVMDSLDSAAKASRSGLIRSAVDAALPEVRSGAQVGPLLARSSAFPTDMKQSLLVAEETGSMDAELPRLAAEYQRDGLSRLSRFSEWMPRMIYLGVVVFLAYNVISGYKNYIDGMMRQFDSL